MGRPSLSERFRSWSQRARVYIRLNPCRVVVGSFVGITFVVFVSLLATLPSLWLSQVSGTCNLQRSLGNTAAVNLNYCFHHDENVRSKATSFVGNTSRLNFVVVGDWGRNGFCCQRDTAFEFTRAANDISADFVVNTGDNFYPYGLQTADDAQVDDSWYKIYIEPETHQSFTPSQKATMQRLKWYNVLGNHDYRGKPSVQLDIGKRYPQWVMPSRYYDKLYGDGKVHIFYIDTNPLIPEYYHDSKMKANVESQDPKAQLKWLEKGLKNSKALWKIVVGHHPIYTVGAHGKQVASLISSLKPILVDNGVHMYFSGHDHDLQYLTGPEGLPGPSSPESRAVGSGRDDLRYFVSGAGSRIRPMYTIDNSVQQETGFRSGAGEPGFLTVSLELVDNDPRVIVNAINYKGDRVFQYQNF
eukprot:g34.t1